MCVYCGSCVRITVDHYLPRKAGGRNRHQNLLTACLVCNTRKHNRTPRQWWKFLRDKCGWSPVRVLKIQRSVRRQLNKDLK
jgi:5-methylcytosine-specific restriction endonuclease McrA